MLNVFAQNSNYFCTSTSAFSEMLRLIHDNWQKFEAFKGQGIFKFVKPRIMKTLRAMIDGYYPEMESQRIFEKDRGWLGLLPLLDDLFKVEHKILVTTRDPRDAFASFERMRAKNPLGTPAVRFQNPKAGNFEHTQYGRCRAMFAMTPTLPDGSPGHVGLFGAWVLLFRDLRDNPEMKRRIIHVPYPDLVHAPKDTFKAIEDAFGFKPFDGYDFENVKQLTDEDDQAHHWEGLHTVSAKPRKAKKEAWKDILSDPVAGWLTANFADLIEISKGDYTEST